MYGRFCLLVALVALLLVAVNADIDQSTITGVSYTNAGSASVTSNNIQVTPNSANQAGIAQYSTQQTISNGLVTTFTYTSALCSPSASADGFTFVISPTLLTSTYGSGNNLAIAGATNVAVVAFDLFNSNLRVCSTNLTTPLAWASSCVYTTLTPDLRCSGSHTVKIAFTPPSQWEIWIDNTSKGTFVKDLTNTLTTVNGLAFIGFTGATGPSYYLRQRITAWSLNTAADCSATNGGCSLDATCTVVSGARQCTCNEGFTGDGLTCTLITPVAVPIAAPVYVEPPVAEPVSPPVDPPVTPPVSEPVAAPVDVPLAQPVAEPIAAPVTPPTSAPITPISAPVAPPMSIDVPVAMPVIIPILECFDDLKNGTFIAYFGYNNTMSERVSLSVGPMNTFGSSSSFIGQPTTFETGRSDFYPNAAFAYLWNGKTLTWTLTSFRLTLDTSDTSRKCPSFARFTLKFYTERELTDEEVNAISSGLSGALGISAERVRVLSIKYTPVTRKRDLSVAELEMEIAAANSTQQNEPSPSQAVQTLVETSKNTTALTSARSKWHSKSSSHRSQACTNRC